MSLGWLILVKGWVKMASCKIIMGPNESSDIIFKADESFFVVTVSNKHAACVSAFLMLVSEKADTFDETAMQEYVNAVLELCEILGVNG